MTRKIIAAAIMLIAGLAWLGLDYLDKQEKAEAEAVHQALASARARAVAEEKAKAEARERFEAELRTELANCKADADKASNDYTVAHQKPARGKKGQPTVPKAVMEEAAKMLETANAECQKNHDARLNSGV